MDHRSIYESNAEQYQRLVAAEDVDGNLASHLAELLPPPPGLVAEIGAGTGRVTRLLRQAGASVIATEPAEAMLAVAARLSAGDPEVMPCRAEARALPMRSGRADAAVAGWVFAHQREWSPDNWREVVAGFIAEARRVVVDGGPVVLIETLGTGHEEPTPTPDLAEYYGWLEAEMGFARRWIRTDYRFPTVAEAAEITGSFFGSAFGELVVENGWSRIPECTGIWTSR